MAQTEQNKSHTAQNAAEEMAASLRAALDTEFEEDGDGVPGATLSTEEYNSVFEPEEPPYPQKPPRTVSRTANANDIPPKRRDRPMRSVARTQPIYGRGDSTAPAVGAERGLLRYRVISAVIATTVVLTVGALYIGARLSGITTEAVIRAGDAPDTPIGTQLTEGYAIRDKRGDTVGYALTESDIANAAALGSESLKKRLTGSDLYPDSAEIAIKDAYTVEPTQIATTDIQAGDALADVFCKDIDGIFSCYDITVSYTESTSSLIPYETAYIANDENFDGVTTLISPGVNGLQTVTYTVEVDYRTGEEISRAESARNVTREAIDAVSYEGVYPLPDGVSTGTFLWPLPPLPDDELPLDENGNPYVPENPFALKNTYISSGYGERLLWGNPDFHLGYDIVAPVYTEIYASDGGVVTWATYTDSYGYMVRIQHANGVETLYAHQAKMAVKVGDVVKQGDVIGYVGSSGVTSGTHLHFEFRYEHVTTDPANYITIPEDVYVIGAES